MDARRILVTDLDGTLLGSDAGLARFRAWLASRGDEYLLVYASGRDLASIQDLVADTTLPVPNAMITSVGTEIFDGAGRRWPSWPPAFDAWDAALVRDLLRPVRSLSLQATTHQTPWKASYELTRSSTADRDAIEGTLADAGVAALIVESADRYLDILPAGAGKGNTAHHVAACLGVVPDDVLAFGDSGNDLELLNAGFRATMVANALPELRRDAVSSVYRSPLTFADGVLDGIRHWSGHGSPATFDGQPPTLVA